MAIQSSVKLRQIAANFGKFRFKNNGDHFFEKIVTDRIAEGLPKKNGDHSGGEILAVWCAPFLWSHDNFFFQFKEEGGFGSWAVSHPAYNTFYMKYFLI